MTMLIHDLIKLGRAVGVDMALSFPAKSHHLALRLGDEGEILDFAEVEDCPVRLPWAVPRTNNVVGNIFYDNASYIFGDVTKKEKSLHRMEVMAKAHQAIADKSKSKAAMAVAKFLHARMEVFKKTRKLGPAEPFGDLIRVVTKAKAETVSDQKLSGTNIVFYYKDSPRPICEDERLYDVIAECVRNTTGTLVDVPSLYDDSAQSVAGVHPKLQPSPGSKPAALVASHAEVTKMFVVVDSVAGNGETRRVPMGTAPMSYESVRLYVGAMTWLIQNARIPMPPSKGNNLNTYGWTDTPGHRFEKIVRDFNLGPGDKTSDEWRTWVEGVTNDPSLLDDTTPYRVLCIEHSDRLTVRDYVTTTVGDAMRGIRRYVQDFSVNLRPLMLTPFSVTLGLLGKKKRLTAHDAQAFIQAMLLGGTYAYPLALLHEAVRSYEHSMEVQARDIRALDLATMHAFKPMVNFDNHPHYLAGRLFGVLCARANVARDRGDQASIPARMTFVAADPASNFTGVFQLTQVHLRKLEKKGWYTFLSDEEEVIALVQAAGGLPERANAQEKALFYLGHRFEIARQREKAKQARASRKEKAA